MRSFLPPTSLRMVRRMTTAAPRKCMVAANFKCNGTRASLAALVDTFNGGGTFPSNVEVVVAPTALHLGLVQGSLRKDMALAVQNVWEQPKAGAWTGELTVDLVKDFGVDWTILGHSERRTYCNEDSAKVGHKVSLALEGGLNVIPCIGEQLADREANKTMEVLMEQLDPILAAVPTDAWPKVVVAYEPVWAIGTGVTATPAQAQDTHADIRKYMASKIGASTAAQLRILYGGSVNAGNCDELMTQPDIDGFLVGGASLKPEFLKIINSASAKL